MYAPISRAVQRFGTSELFSLQSLDDGLSVTERDLATIVECCNEPLIYRYLFNDPLNGRAYTVDDARIFVDWARRGWREHRYFVFLIKDSHKKIVGYVDISSDILSNSPIGYWVTDSIRGIMTNALNCLMEIAREAGYLKLFALVEPDNTRSTRLLERLGFIHTGSPIEEVTFLGKPTGKRCVFDCYEKELVVE